MVLPFRRVVVEALFRDEWEAVLSRATMCLRTDHLGYHLVLVSGFWTQQSLSTRISSVVLLLLHSIFLCCSYLVRMSYYY